MNKTLRLSLVAATLAAAGAAHALDFQTTAGTAFNQSFLITPTATDSLYLSVSGLAAQFSSLSFSILSGGPTVTAVLSNGSLVASADDWYDTAFSLIGGQSYTLQISGFTKAAAPGIFGSVSINTLEGTVSPVPEPESFAMLLAGLGLMGAIARRRSKAA
jgi:hypothetical protein